MSTPVMLSQFDAFLFDLDGTLIDSSPLHERSFREALREPHPRIEAAFEYDAVRGLTTEHALAHLGVSPVNIAELAEVKRRAYRRYVAYGELSATPGAHELIETLRGAGKRVGLVTSSTRASAIAALEDAKLLTLLEVVVTGSDVPRTKPFPEPYLSAAEQLGVTPARCVAIEDAPAGVRSARSAGMSVWGVHDRSVEQITDRYFKRLADIRSVLDV